MQSFKKKLDADRLLLEKGLKEKGHLLMDKLEKEGRVDVKLKCKKNHHRKSHKKVQHKISHKKVQHKISHKKTQHKISHKKVQHKISHKKTQHKKHARRKPYKNTKNRNPRSKHITTITVKQTRISGGLKNLSITNTTAHSSSHYSVNYSKVKSIIEKSIHSSCTRSGRLGWHLQMP